jgi:Ca2+-binding EF-hand superfamily protein
VLLDPTFEIYRAFDLDENGLVSYAEYKNGMLNMLRSTKSDEELKQMFQVLDTDKNDEFSLYEDLPTTSD